MGRLANAEKWFHFSALLYFRKGNILLAILLLAFALRMYGLAHKGLWGDEIFQARQAQRPLSVILTRSETPEIYDDFVLHYVVLHFVSLVGTDEFWMRLPSVWMSMLALPVTYLLGRRLFGGAAGLGAMVLMAGAPFQIWYAQEARMYAAETFYAALSFYCFVGLWKGRGRWQFLGMTLANTLGLYNHLFAIFPTLAEGGTALIVLGAQLWRQRDFSLRGIWGMRGAAVVASLFCTCLLTLPLTTGVLANAGLQVRGGAIHGAPTVKVDMAFVRDLLMYFGLGADWGWRALVSAGLAGVGLVALLRRRMENGWIMSVFVLAPGILAFVPLAGNLAHRYFIFMQPLYLACIAGGAIWLGNGGVRWLGRGNLLRARRSAVALTMAGGVLLGVMLIPPLGALYGRAKLNDWRSVVNFVQGHATARDVVMIENAAYGVRAYRWYAPQAKVELSSAAELERARAVKRRVWYVSFGGYYDAASDKWARTYLTPLAGDEWEQRELMYRATDGFVFPQGEVETQIYVSDW